MIRFDSLKMPDSNLLNIDPDVLFQQNSISEIGDIQKKLLLEVERKKEEIRVMVGERYRDFIEAADTIADMKITVNNCIKNIDEVKLTCKNIRDFHLIGFKDEPLNSVTRPIINKTVHGIAVQIKLLMIIPEQIWSCIDNEDFITATQLFLFARHIYTGLQLEIGGRVDDKNVTSLLPVIYRQWSLINNLNETLVDVCQTKLGNPELKANVASSCLTSLYLLGKYKNMLELMNIFVALHSTHCLSRTFNRSDKTNLFHSNIKDDAKEKIAICVQVIIKTLELLYNCFVENNDGLILERLTELYKKDASPLINLVNFDDPIGIKFLPPVISEYKLILITPLQPISKKDLSECVSNWMKWVQQFIAEQVASLLKYMNSAKSLHVIRETAMYIETPPNWTEICIALSIDHQDTNIWTSHFQPLITKRIKNIISIHWSEIYEELCKSIKNLLVTKISSKESEINLNWFVWNDLIAQSCVSSDDDIVNSISDLMKGLSMQDRGFTPQLEKICEHLDSNLQKMLLDLKTYLYDNKNSISQNYSSLEDDFKSLLIDKKTVKDYSTNKKLGDRLEIENYLRTCSTENINKIIDYIKNECMSEINSDSASDIYVKTASIITARFLQAIPLLVPNLRNCFIPLQNSIGAYYEEYQLSDQNAINSWEAICKILNENCHTCWMHWIENAKKRLESLLVHMPQEFSVTANVDYLLVQWDAITIEEKDDQDQPISSTIKIPSGPSIKLQQFLYSSSCILDEVVPHTLPKKIHIAFIELLADILLQYYSKVIKNNFNEINQKCALQLLMDVRHSTLLLVTRENKNALSESHAICDMLRERIDPFDYDVFYPRLQINVKRSVQRVQTLLGSLIPNCDQLISIIGTKPLTSGGTADRDPNAFILASQGSASTVWFPLLPIVASTSINRKQIDNKRKKVGQISVSPKNSDSTIPSTSNISGANTVRSSAAAFFGSMTSDWFSN